MPVPGYNSSKTCAVLLPTETGRADYLAEDTRVQRQNDKRESVCGVGQREAGIERTIRTVQPISFQSAIRVEVESGREVHMSSHPQGVREYVERLWADDLRRKRAVPE